MVVIKGQEKKLKKPIKNVSMSAEAKKQLKKIKDYQPIATVAVS